MALELKRLPRHETLQKEAGRYPDSDGSAVETCLHLLHVAGEVEAAYEAHFARHGLSRARFIVLMQLQREEEGLRPAELAERTGVTRPTMTGLLDGLEKEGLILRRAHAEDGRMSLVRLSAKGRQRLEGTLPDHYRRTAALMRGLSSEEREQLEALLTKVAAGIPHVRDT
ncbi:MarR family winged helix-turn-helix transcriptional regulator [Vitiosangium sp. GDMCC 1.1324]|uniref:MarR family winged helix-turn-helix transcriptional regulator n=1 Tax=Vitiosangium sp. (strain GDMCC 1.1324) TaxID=2138576 RepID=UPI000D368A1B|nr:MarR family transcriptional regulator [Vitiosangium sp. GDMCC 1.1324]PTL84595.1 MarR family transcriptional regulator [Vitiosangium sp. GDMCC 1.1324]